jgi:predicted enzyme related to lactoylglutathione lyase
MAKHPVIHFEIVGKDPEALGKFFEDAFGWTLNAHAYPEGAGIEKYIIAMPTGEEMPEGYGINGGFGLVPEGYDGHVTFYVRVDHVEEALKKVESLGGTRMMGPQRVPNGPTIGLFKDPQGHVVGVVDPGIPE